jgi:hypothetical protein
MRKHFLNINSETGSLFDNSVYVPLSSAHCGFAGSDIMRRRIYAEDQIRSPGKDWDTQPGESRDR